jgi:hypothetical protein
MSFADSITSGCAPIPPKNETDDVPARIVDHLWFHSGADVPVSNFERIPQLKTDKKTSSEVPQKKSIAERVKDIILEHVGSKGNPKPYYYGELLAIARDLMSLLPGSAFTDSKKFKETYNGRMSESAFCNDARDQLIDLLGKCEFESDSYITFKVRAYVKSFMSKYTHKTKYGPRDMFDSIVEPGYHGNKSQTAAPNALFRLPGETAVKQPTAEFTTPRVPQKTVPNAPLNAPFRLPGETAVKQPTAKSTAQRVPQKTAPKNIPRASPVQPPAKYPCKPAFRQFKPASQQPSPSMCWGPLEQINEESVNTELLRGMRDGAFIEFIQRQERKKVAKHIVDSLVDYLVD